MYKLALDRTEEAVSYMKDKFVNKIHSMGCTNSFPQSWTLHFLQECDHAVNILVEAYLNREKTEWSAEDYAKSLTPRCTGRNPSLERALDDQYPAIYCRSKYVTDPCTVTDISGISLVWYLPGILTERQQNLLWGSLMNIQSSFNIDNRSSSWRVSPLYYYEPDNGLKPGNLSLSPAWFQQGHESTHQIEVSANLSKTLNLKWLKDNLDVFALLGGILCVMHPELYKAGCEAMKLIAREPSRVRKGHMLHDIFQVWASPYNVISVISNRKTPLHRDSGSAFSWPDLLLALGKYEYGELDLPGVGFRLRYKSGTVVGILSRLIRHGAECDGQRACIALYMRENVLKELNTDAVGWMNMSIYD